ncbi:hypothetical protein SAMN03159353_102185 [Cedecea sp. NFIX57]|nr:hypothetical protein SAMN03159353_102185 [Cedecea sp. NFIX57]
MKKGVRTGLLALAILSAPVLGDGKLGLGWRDIPQKSRSNDRDVPLSPPRRHL